LICSEFTAAVMIPTERASVTRANRLIPRTSRLAARLVLTALACLGLCGLLWPPGAAADQTSDEVKLGAQIAREIESHYRVVTDPAMVERLNRVSAALVSVVDRQDISYHFRIIDVPGVNALSVPGGWVFITRGMMKFVRSDDELAAVVAHELTHVAHRHYYIQQKRQNAMIPEMIIAAALSVLARSVGPMLAGQMMTQGAMANYQRDLEKEADLTGVSYLVKSTYSPVAMLTLLEHLSQVDKLTGQVDLGDYYLDHPRPEERAAYVQQDLIARGIPISRRTAEGYLRIEVDPAGPASADPAVVVVDGLPVIRIGASAQGQTPAERARALAARLDKFFNTDPEPFDVRVVNVLDRWAVVGGQTPLFEVTPQDATFAGGSSQAVAEEFRVRLSQVLSAAPYYRKF
jgi:Zn-dependent protease with chaperone function